MKQGDYIKTWHGRWFVLKQGKLLRFDATSGSQLDAAASPTTAASL